MTPFAAFAIGFLLAIVIAVMGLAVVERQIWQRGFRSGYWAGLSEAAAAPQGTVFVKPGWLKKLTGDAPEAEITQTDTE